MGSREDQHPFPSGEEGLILDGYNVIFRLAPHCLESPEEIRRLKGILETRLEILARREGLHPWIVYDGRRRPAPGSGGGEAVSSPGDPQRNGPAARSTGGSVRISYVEPPAEADDFIHQMARQVVSHGGSVRVVTSDQKLGRRLAGLGVRVVAVEALETDLLLIPGLPDGGGRKGGKTPLDVEAHFLSLEGAVDPTALVEGSLKQPSGRSQTADAAAPPPPPQASRETAAAAILSRPVSPESSGRTLESKELRRIRGLRRQKRRLEQPKSKRRRRRH